MKRVLIAGFFAFLLLISLVSAFSFSNFWSKITGQATFGSLKSINICNDSDNGLNYDVKGKTSITNAEGKAIKSQTDKCIVRHNNKANLIEYYCRKNIISSFYYKCPFGCENGVCNSNKPRCAGLECGGVCYTQNYISCINGNVQYSTSNLDYPLKIYEMAHPVSYEKNSRQIITFKIENPAISQYDIFPYNFTIRLKWNYRACIDNPVSLRCVEDKEIFSVDSKSNFILEDNESINVSFEIPTDKLTMAGQFNMQIIDVKRIISDKIDYIGNSPFFMSKPISVFDPEFFDEKKHFDSYVGMCSNGDYIGGNKCLTVDKINITLTSSCSSLGSRLMWINYTNECKSPKNKICGNYTYSTFDEYYGGVAATCLKNNIYSPLGPIGVTCSDDFDCFQNKKCLEFNCQTPDSKDRNSSNINFVTSLILLNDSQAPGVEEYLINQTKILESFWKKTSASLKLNRVQQKFNYKKCNVSRNNILEALSLSNIDMRTAEITSLCLGNKNYSHKFFVFLFDNNATESNNILYQEIRDKIFEVPGFAIYMQGGNIYAILYPDFEKDNQQHLTEFATTALHEMMHSLGSPDMYVNSYAGASFIFGDCSLMKAESPDLRNYSLCPLEKYYFSN